MKKLIKRPERLPPKVNVQDWVEKVLDLAGIADYSYPLKGCGVWLPYGWKLRMLIIDLIRKMLEETGHQETYFPMLIPEDIFMKEAEFIKGFENEVYWVTHGGKKELKVKLAIRPTSETPMYHMFSKWVRSHADLPIKYWQVVNMFRYETKSTRPLFRLREVTTFKEAHTVHRTLEEAEKQVKEAIEIYSKFFDLLGIPYIVSRRPEYDKFPGALETYAFDTILPDGKTLQIGTVHNLGQNFAKAFGIEYTDANGERKYAYQTCYGISERVIGSIIVIHGDDHGLILPPVVAPIQVVVIPITFKEKPGVEEYAQEIYETLKKEFRVTIDLGDKRPGEKFYIWEIKGVPLRVEIGPNEKEKQTVTLVRRDNFKRITVSKVDLNKEVKNILDLISRELRERAWEKFRARLKRVEKFIDFNGGEDALTALLDEDGTFKGGIAEIPVCDNPECELKIRRYVDILGCPLEGGKVHGKCICGREGTRILRIASQY